MVPVPATTPHSFGHPRPSNFSPMKRRQFLGSERPWASHLSSQVCCPTTPYELCFNLCGVINAWLVASLTSEDFMPPRPGSGDPDSLNAYFAVIKQDAATGGGRPAKLALGATAFPFTTAVAAYVIEPPATQRAVTVITTMPITAAATAMHYYYASLMD